MTRACAGPRCKATFDVASEDATRLYCCPKCRQNAAERARMDREKATRAAARPKVIPCLSCGVNVNVMSRGRLPWKCYKCGAPLVR